MRSERMPGYQRFVTYMFRYKDEKKQENCGFAKIEIRQGHCRVQIQITGMKGSEAEVYFLSKDAYVPVGIYLGKLQIQEGIARQFFLCEADHVGETAYSIREMRGLYICQQGEPGRFIASQWDDVGTVWRNLKLQKGTESEAENRSEEDFVENDVEKEEMTDQMDPIGGQKEADTEKADTEEEGQGDSGEPAQEQKNQLTGELHATQTAEAISIPAENRDALYQKNQPFPHNQEKNLCPAVGAWEKQWECFCAAHPLCCPFDEDGNVYAVKLQMQDFKILPKEYQYLANNSFLLHGYFNYKMVLFGYMEAEQRQWFLGVPGVFSNQEQLMAGIFGFPEFRTKQMTRQKTGEFGYWYRFIEI